MGNTVAVYTWKVSDYFDGGYQWHNEYVFDVPYEVKDQQAYDLAQLTMSLERGILMDTCYYEYAVLTKYPNRALHDKDAARLVPPKGTEYAGYQPTPDPPPDEKYWLLVTKPTSFRRWGRWLFFPSIYPNKLFINPKGKTYLLPGRYQQTVMQDWLYQWSHYAQATLLVPQGTSKGGEPIAYAPVTSLEAEAVTCRNAANRWFYKATTGVDEFSASYSNAQFCLALHVEGQGYYDFDGDLVPNEWRTNCRNIISACQSGYGLIGAYIEDTTGGSQPQPVPAYFRFPPTPAAAKEACEKADQKCGEDIDKINQMIPTPGPGGHLYITHDECGEILEMLRYHESVNAQLSIADWHNFRQAPYPPRH